MLCELSFDGSFKDRFRRECGTSTEISRSLRSVSVELCKVIPLSDCRVSRFKYWSLWEMRAGSWLSSICLLSLTNQHSTQT